jgi:RNA polymerase sigma-70 factor (ECF subfamily)
VLLRRHDRRVYRTVRSILGSEEEVEDAMQDAWLLAYGHLADFEGASAFSTWLTRIAVNAALGRLRKSRPLVPVPTEAFDEVEIGGGGDDGGGPHDPEDRAARAEELRLLERAVDRLPPIHRTVFVLREIEGLSTAEAAQALGIGADAVKVRLHRARLALRDLLAAEIGRAAPEAFPFHAPRCNRIVERVMGAIHAMQGAGGSPHP